MKLGVISLGCDKATVDSERLVGDLVGHGAVVTSVLPEADVILVNTCGFIDAAKQESIDAILAAAKLKESGVKAVVAVGCLVQRYKQELTKEIPEVDLFLGFSELHHLIPELAQRGLIADPVAAHPGVASTAPSRSPVSCAKRNNSRRRARRRSTSSPRTWAIGAAISGSAVRNCRTFSRRCCARPRCRGSGFSTSTRRESASAWSS